MFAKPELDPEPVSSSRCISPRFGAWVLVGVLSVVGDVFDDPEVGEGLEEADADVEVESLVEVEVDPTDGFRNVSCDAVKILRGAPGTSLSQIGRAHV